MSPLASMVVLIALGSGVSRATPPPTCAPPIAVEDPVVAMDVELHFQEGFGGETVVVTVDGAEVARVMARTRMQIGLAHIETLRLTPGQTVTIGLPEQSLVAVHAIEAGKPFVQIALEGGALRIRSSETSPGYM